MRLPVLIAALLVTSLPSSAVAGEGPLPQSSLELSSHGLPGFRGAQRTVEAALSSTQWAREETHTEAEFQETNARLIEQGFEQGVYTRLDGPREGPRRREAASWVTVFTTAAGAQRQLALNVAQDSKFAHSMRFRAGAIPGAVGIGGLHDHGRHGGFANVLFATGRCQVVVGDAFPGHAPDRLEKHPATVGALVLYRRLGPLCA